MTATMDFDLAAIPREYPQFGKSVWNVGRRREEVFGGQESDVGKGCGSSCGEGAGKGCVCAGSGRRGEGCCYGPEPVRGASAAISSVAYQGSHAMDFFAPYSGNAEQSSPQYDDKVLVESLEWGRCTTLYDDVQAPARSCGAASEIAKRGNTDYCIEAKCSQPRKRLCVLPFGGSFLVQCACLENWKVQKHGWGLDRSVWSDRPTKHTIDEMRLLAKDFYGVNQCYVTRWPWDGCKCKCWVNDRIVPYAPNNWHTDCGINGGEWIFGHPGVFDPPSGWR